MKNPTSLKEYVDNIQATLFDFKYKSKHEGVTLNEIEEACLSFVKLIKIFEARSKSDHKKRNDIISILQTLSALMLESKKRIDEVKPKIFKHLHEDVLKSINCFNKYPELCPSLPKKSLHQITLCFTETSKKLMILDQDIQISDSFYLAVDALIQCRKEVSSLFLKLMDFPLYEHEVFIKQETADILEILFDHNIKLLTKWKNHDQLNYGLYQYCSNHDVLGNVRH